MSRHANIPIFIPHLGCPNQCVFCNQRTISGLKNFDISEVDRIINEALSTIEEDAEVEIAFFGGSFTGIDRELMISLLKIANNYIKRGRVSSLRCSTRPDYIDSEVLSLLREYGVKTVELGFQSISDNVLNISKRGHKSIDSRQAARLILEHGFSLVGQMMIGLPGATLQDELDTADFIISSGASFARIYPTVVFRDTELCDMTNRSEYTPLSIDDAVVRSASVLKRFVDAGVKVIRIGLCSSENLAGDDTYFAGPNHPALGELVESELYYYKIKDELSKKGTICSDVHIGIPLGAVSKAVGHKKNNTKRLSEEFKITNLKFTEDSTLSEYGVYIYD